MEQLSRCMRAHGQTEKVNKTSKPSYSQVMRIAFSLLVCRKEGWWNDFQVEWGPQGSFARGLRLLSSSCAQGFSRKGVGVSPSGWELVTRLVHWQEEAVTLTRPGASRPVAGAELALNLGRQIVPHSLLPGPDSLTQDTKKKYSTENDLTSVFPSSHFTFHTTHKASVLPSLLAHDNPRWTLMTRWRWTSLRTIDHARSHRWRSSSPRNSS